MTRCPCSTRSAAATEESTPPDMATMMVMGFAATAAIVFLPGPGSRRGAHAAQYRDDAPRRLVDLRLRRRPAQGESHRRGPLRRAAAHRRQDVAELDRAARARRTAGRGHTLQIQRHQNRLL